MKLIFTALVFSVCLAGCATSTTKTSTEPSDPTASETYTLPDTVIVNENGGVSATDLYSNDEIMGIMFFGTERNPAKFAARLERAKGFPLGSKQNPVRAHRPRGEVSYLRRLECEDGTRPGFERAGSFGAGPYETILDGYSLTCSGVSREGLVYMDMYHIGHIESAAIPGFTIDQDCSSSRLSEAC